MQNYFSNFQNIRDLILFSIVGGLLMIDLIILLAWNISDPMRGSILTLPTEVRSLCSVASGRMWTLLLLGRFDQPTQLRVVVDHI